MRGTAVKNLRREAQRRTMQAPLLAYSQGKINYVSKSGEVVRTADGTRTLVSECTRSVYQRLKRAYMQLRKG